MLALTLHPSKLNIVFRKHNVFSVVENL